MQTLLKFLISATIFVKIRHLINISSIRLARTLCRAVHLQQLDERVRVRRAPVHHHADGHLLLNGFLVLR